MQHLEPITVKTRSHAVGAWAAPVFAASALCADAGVCMKRQPTCALHCPDVSEQTGVESDCKGWINQWLLIFLINSFSISLFSITDRKQPPFSSFVEGYLSVSIFMSHSYVTDVLGDDGNERILAL